MHIFLQMMLSVQELCNWLKIFLIPYHLFVRPSPSIHQLWIINYYINTSSEHLVVHTFFFCLVLTFRTIHVHNMFWVCNFHVLNWYFNSVVIFWVHWSKNKSLWQIFTCNEKINTCLETFILDVSISDYWEEQWNKSKQLYDVIVDDP